MSIWVTSDLHLNHKNIITHSRSNFVDIETHNKYIIDQYNSCVGPDDLVYILGDLGFTPRDSLRELSRQLNGRKILLPGNHDQLKDSEYLGMGFIQVIRHPVYYNNNIILSHIPVQEAFNNPWVINVHGHIHNGKLDLPNFINVNVENTDYKPVNINELEKIAQKICIQFRYQHFGQEWYKNFEKKQNNG